MVVRESKRRKLTYVISKVEHAALEFLWVAQRLNHAKVELVFILLNQKDSDLQKELSKYSRVYHIQYRSKRNVITAFFKLLTLLAKVRPHILHTHMLDANLLGLFCGKLLFIKHRIYTRHHSALNHEYYPSKVIYDRLSNWMASQIVSISDCVSDILISWEGVNPSKVNLIPHGIDLNHFSKVDSSVANTLGLKYNPSEKGPIIGVISRYTEWKGVQYIIPAFKNLLEKYPDSLLVLANAKKGEYIAEIENLLRELPNESFREIPFENNISVLYRLFDVFVHVPIDKYSEAFGQIYLEALATKTPSIFTLSGIANDIIVDQENALVVQYKDSQSIYDAMICLLENKDLCDKLAKNGFPIVSEHFTVERKITALNELYRKLA